MPPTTFEYSPRDEFLTSQEAIVHLRESRELMPDLASEAVFDVDHDGRLDVLEGYARVYRNQGASSNGQVTFVEDCIHPVPSAPGAYLGATGVLLDSASSLTLTGQFEHRSGAGLSFLARTNVLPAGFVKGDRTLPGVEWTHQRIVAEGSYPCTETLPSPTPRKNWKFVEAGQNLINTDTLLPRPPAGKQQDGVLFAGDIDGDGLPDGYVQANRSTDSVPVVRFSRRALMTAPYGIAALAERVVSNLSVARYECANSVSCMQTITRDDGSVATIQLDDTQLRFDDTYRSLVDMNGDGLADFVTSTPMRNPDGITSNGVYLRDVQFGYFAGNARGLFGCNPYKITGAADPKLCMHSVGTKNSVTPGLFGVGTSSTSMRIGPPFDGPFPLWRHKEYPQRTIAFHDINGDGYADVVIAKPDEVVDPNDSKKLLPTWTLRLEIYLNDMGLTFHRFCNQDPTGRICSDLTDPVVVRDSAVDPPVANDRISFGDMNADGIDDIVVTGPGNLTTLTLNRARVTPGLLTTVHNGLGATTSYDYETYQRHSFGAEPVEENKLEQVTTVVTAVRTTNNLRPSGTARFDDFRLYRYRKPAFDPWTRNLAGFGEVTTTTPHGVTVDTYYFDSCRRGTGCDGSSDSSPLSGGLHRSSTVYSSDPKEGPAVALRTTIKSYKSQLLPYTDGRRRYFVYGDQTFTYVYDTTQSANPTLVSHPVVSYTDKEYPHVDSQSEVVWTDTNTALLYTTQTYDTNGNQIRHEDFGRVQPDLTPVDLPVVTEQATTEMPAGAGIRPYVWRVDWKKVYAPGAAYAQSYRLQTFTYKPDTGELLTTSGKLEGTLPLSRFHEGGAPIAPNPVGASTDRVIELSRVEYDGFGNVVRSLGPVTETVNGPRRTCHETQFDGTHARLPIRETAYLDGCQTGSSMAHVSANQVWDRGFTVRTMTNSQGQTTTVELDAFGRATKVWDPSPNGAGIQEIVPRAEFRYVDADPVSRVEVKSRDSIPGILQYQTRTGYAYSDGLGRALLTLSPDGNGGLIAYGAHHVAAGLRIYEYAPFQYGGSTSVKKVEFDPPNLEPSLYRAFDEFGRLVGTYDGGIPGSWKPLSHIEYRGLQKVVSDANDLDPSSAGYNTPELIEVDGHGQVTWDVQTYRENGVSQDRYTTWAYLPTGEPWIEVHGSSSSSVSMFKEKHYDTFGRLVGSWDQDSVANGVEWRYAYNDAGLVVGTSDPRGCGVNVHYDAANRPVAEDVSPCLSTHQPYSAPDFATGDGTEGFSRYDAPEPGVSPTEYGSSFAFAGRILSHRDRGSYTRYRYDLLGRPVGLARQIAKPGPPDSTIADRFAPHWYRKEAVFDGIDRVVKESTGADVPELLGAGGESATTYVYGPRNSVTSVGSSYGPLVAGTSLRVDGLPGAVTYGDVAGTVATLGYNDHYIPEVTDVQITRGAPPLWSQASYPPPSSTPTQMLALFHGAYAYDPSGNPTSILDSGSGYPAGSLPRQRTIQHDSLNRVVSVTTEAVDIHKSIFEAEGATGRAVPRSSQPNPTTTQTYEYDFLNNVVRADDDQSVLWDRSQGLETHSLTHPTQVVSTDAARVNYDVAGNMVDVLVTRPGPCEFGQACNQRFVYDWDEVGNLARARRWDLLSVGDQTPRYPDAANGDPAWDLAYTYSGMSRVLKAATAASGEVDYTLEVFDSLRINRTTFEDGDYLRTPQTVAPYLGALGRVVYGDAGLPGDGTAHARVLLQLGDHLGSASIIIDKETSELVERIEYDANGTTESDYRPDPRWRAFREELRFTGKEEDIEVGLTYFGARYLSTYLRRWISPDPLTVHAWGADPNPYSYVSGQSMSATDPFGFDKDQDDKNTADKSTKTEKDGSTSYWDYGKGQYEISDVPHPKANVDPAPPTTPEPGPSGGRAELRTSAEDRVDRLIGRIATVTAAALLPDKSGVYRIGKSEVHSETIPGHTANGVVKYLQAGVEMGVLGAFHTLYTYRTGKVAPTQAAMKAAVKTVHIDIAPRSPNDDTESWVEGALFVADVAITHTAIGKSAAKAATVAEAGSNAFRSGKGAHTALVTVIRNGDIIAADTLVSGNMTAEEAALGFPKSSLATHTEARAVKMALQAGDTMIIEGQYPACNSCKGAMNKVAASSGAQIHYLWDDLVWSAGKR